MEEKSLPDEIYMAHYEFDDDEEEEVDRGDLIRRFRALRYILNFKYDHYSCVLLFIIRDHCDNFNVKHR